MLLLGHAGYTVGYVWALQTKRVARHPVDYRLIMAAAFLPDAIDRLLFLLLPSYTEGGRLIAHTLLFNLLLLALLTWWRPRYWPYGLASLTHLLFDLPLQPEHLLWPLLGGNPGYLGLTRDAAAGPYGAAVIDHLKSIFTPYDHVARHVIVLEMGGSLVLAAFFVGERLYRRRRLWQFVASGHASGG